MSDLCSQTIAERTQVIEDALAQVFDIEGIAIEYNQGDQQLIVSQPSDYEAFIHHDLWAIARDLERRLFPNG
ncbi:hypothetical protein [Celeribacter baekdonensis]|uniref:hypothetical protein n=1 Tax=Celeribacter baekdonensis TaxID=875171 RepID=UPI0030D822E3|tara:strand:- start:26350 stop:26565 length:216 start_codon:yes stop_codon:yes gene_type:complete